MLVNAATAASDAKRFIRKVRASKSAFERGYNSGDAAYLAAQQLVEVKRAGEAEQIAKLYGCRCDWPGLYPVLENRQGRSEYATANLAAVSRFFAESLS